MRLGGRWWWCLLRLDAGLFELSLQLFDGLALLVDLRVELIPLAGQAVDFFLKPVGFKLELVSFDPCLVQVCPDRGDGYRQDHENHRRHGNADDHPWFFHDSPPGYFE